MKRLSMNPAAIYRRLPLSVFALYTSLPADQVITVDTSRGPLFGADRHFHQCHKDLCRAARRWVSEGRAELILAMPNVNRLERSSRRKKKIECAINKASGCAYILVDPAFTCRISSQPAVIFTAAEDDPLQEAGSSHQFTTATHHARRDGYSAAWPTACKAERFNATVYNWRHLIATTAYRRGVAISCLRDTVLYRNDKDDMPHQKKISNLQIQLYLRELGWCF